MQIDGVIVVAGEMDAGRCRIHEAVSGTELDDRLHLVDVHRLRLGVQQTADVKRVRLNHVIGSGLGADKEKGKLWRENDFDVTF